MPHGEQEVRVVEPVVPETAPRVEKSPSRSKRLFWRLLAGLGVMGAGGVVIHAASAEEVRALEKQPVVSNWTPSSTGEDFSLPSEDFTTFAPASAAETPNPTPTLSPVEEVLATGLAQTPSQEPVRQTYEALMTDLANTPTVIPERATYEAFATEVAQTQAATTLEAPIVTPTPAAPVKVETKPTATFTPPAETGREVVEGHQILNLGRGVLVEVNEAGVPLAYRSGDQWTELSESEIVQAELAQAEAQQNRESEPAFSITFPAVESEEFIIDPLLAEPVVTELPRDVVPESELRNYGIIELIQADNTSLYLRQAAFEPGGMLYDLVELQAAEGHVQMRIVLVDAPFISAHFMDSNDHRYDHVRDIAGSVDLEYMQRRQEAITSMEAKIVALQRNIDQAQLNHTFEEAQLESELAIAKAELAAILAGDEATWVTELMPRGGTTAALFHPYEFTVDQQIVTIMVSTGADTKPAYQDTMHVYFNSNGEIRAVMAGNGASSPNMTPRNHLSYPSRFDFRDNPLATHQNGDYLYGAQAGQIGFALAHELEHFSKIIAEPFLEDTLPNRNEFDTDVAAMEYIEQAYEQWRSAGDDTGYQFLFSVPEEHGGGYQLTAAQHQAEPPTRELA